MVEKCHVNRVQHRLATDGVRGFHWFLFIPRRPLFLHTYILYLISRLISRLSPFFTANDMSRSEMKVHDLNTVQISRVSNSGKTAKARALISVQLHIAKTVLVVLNKT